MNVKKSDSAILNSTASHFKRSTNFAIALYHFRTSVIVCEKNESRCVMLRLILVIFPSSSTLQIQKNFQKVQLQAYKILTKSQEFLINNDMVLRPRHQYRNVRRDTTLRKTTGIHDQAVASIISNFLQLETYFYSFWLHVEIKTIPINGSSICRCMKAMHALAVNAQPNYWKV